MNVKYIWRQKETSVDVEEGYTLLDGAIIAGLEPPYSCHEGVCGTCEAILQTGERVRTCQTLAKSDLTIVNYDKA